MDLSLDLFQQCQRRVSKDDFNSFTVNILDTFCKDEINKLIRENTYQPKQLKICYSQNFKHAALVWTDIVCFPWDFIVIRPTLYDISSNPDTSPYTWMVKLNPNEGT